MHSFNAPSPKTTIVKTSNSVSGKLFSKYGPVRQKILLLYLNDNNSPSYLVSPDDYGNWYIDLSNLNTANYKYRISIDNCIIRNGNLRIDNTSIIPQSKKYTTTYIAACVL